MSPKPDSPAGPRPKAARALAQAGGAFVVALPLAMWLANRSAPLMLALAALCCLASGLAAGQGRAQARRALALLARPEALAAAAFLLWALLSLGWSHRPAQGLAMWGELALPLLCGLAIAAGGGLPVDDRLRRALALSLILACALIGFELASGLSQRAALGIGRPHGFVFNRPAVTLLFVAAALLGTMPWRAAAPFDRLLALLAGLAVALLVLLSDSGAAKLGLAVLVPLWLLGRLAPRAALALVALGFVATAALAPSLGRLGEAVLSGQVHERLSGAHSRERLDIWLSFGEAVGAHPLRGAGFGASASLDAHPVALTVAPAHRTMLAAGHPHSAPLQAWVETGAVGMACLVVAGLLLLWRWRRAGANLAAPRLALFAAAFAVASVAHGAWQGWWIATLVVAALVMAGGGSARPGSET